MKFHKTTEGKIVLSVAGVLVGLLGYYGLVMTTGSDEVKTTGEVAVTERDHIRGGTAASVTVVEFGDFECPACGHYEPIVRALSAKYKDDMRIVFKNFPLLQIHRNAGLAAQYAEAAAIQGKFWEMHDMLYDKQEEWGEALNAEDYILAYGKTLSLDIDKLKTDANSDVVKNKIMAELTEGTRLNVQGTPTFFVNGVKADNANLEAAIVAAIKK